MHSYRINLTYFLIQHSQIKHQVSNTLNFSSFVNYTENRLHENNFDINLHGFDVFFYLQILFPTSRHWFISYRNIFKRWFIEQDVSEPITTTATAIVHESCNYIAIYIFIWWIYSRIGHATGINRTESQVKLSTHNFIIRLCAWH